MPAYMEEIRRYFGSARTSVGILRTIFEEDCIVPQSCERPPNAPSQCFVLLLHQSETPWQSALVYFVTLRPLESSPLIISVKAPFMHMVFLKGAELKTHMHTQHNPDEDLPLACAGRCACLYNTECICSETHLCHCTLRHDVTEISRAVWNSRQRLRVRVKDHACSTCMVDLHSCHSRAAQAPHRTCIRQRSCQRPHSSCPLPSSEVMAVTKAQCAAELYWHYSMCGTMRWLD